MRRLVASSAIAVAMLGGASCSSSPTPAAPVDIPSASPIAQTSSSAPRAAASAIKKGPCGGPCIEGTDIEDTDENRAVLAFVEMYRKALEDRDVDRLSSLASLDYHDDGGTPDPSDDLDASGLRMFLEFTLGKLAQNKVEIHYHRVHDEGGHLLVEFTMSSRYTFKKAPDAWQTQPPREALLILERSGGSFKILKGM